MRRTEIRKIRRGAIVPLVAISLVAVLGLVALAIDIGMVAVARTQAQNAADSAAMVGTRTFNQQVGYNLTSVPKQAIIAAVANKIFSANIVGDPNTILNPSADVYTSGQVKIECGGYYYVYNDANPAAEGFQIVLPPTGKAATEPYTAVRATISSTSPVFFGNVFGASPFNVTAHAIAAHRPRDVIIIMDLSGSMRFQSCPAAYTTGGSTMYPHWGPRNVSLNPDPNFPVFGHYSATALAALQGTASGTTGVEIVDPSNYVYPWAVSGPSCMPDFMTSGSTPAFSAKPISQATTPGGDNYVKSGGAYVKTINDIVGATPTIANQMEWCRNGYSSAVYNGGAAFNGYVEGPNYWGKTFFVWPPDPRGSDLDPSNSANHANNGAKDWRQRFFFKQNTSTNALYWLDNNTILFDPSGAPAVADSSGVTPILKSPNTPTAIIENGISVNYRLCVNYAAIFQWLKNTAPTHFPASMTTGRINYYSKIPDPTGDASFNNRFWTQSPMTDLSERFWKDYVDFMLGYVESAANTYSNNDGSNPWTSYIGNGDFFPWGTVQTLQKPDSNYTATVNNVGGYAAGYNGVLAFNNIANLAGATVDLPGPQPITGATNAAPIVITSANHGLSAGQFINLTGVGGNTAANNSSNAQMTTWKVGTTTTNTFQILTTTGGKTAGNGTYTANTGSWIPAITAATNASPIVITTGAPHGLPTTLPTSSSASGTPVQTVNITGVTGNTAANGKWTITVIDSTHFSLNNSSGSGAYNNTLGTQWWEPVYYIRFGTQSTFYELNPALTPIGILTATADIALTQAIANGTAVKIYTAVPKYMDYNDNPNRPKHHYWFGPQTWADWLGNYAVYQYPNGTYTLRWPGNVHEAQAWTCKIGISSAIDDIKNNHPNDFVGLTFFSSPSYSTGGGGQHNMSVIPLGRNYQGMKDSLWFPPSTVSGAAATITPYDTDMNNVPRAKGGTCPQMGLMIGYNMLSSSTASLRYYATPTATYRGYAGGVGRKGASKLVIFETDGAPNTAALAALAGTGSDSYYPIRIKDPTNIANGQNEFPTGAGYQDSAVYPVVQQICALDTASPPGYSTSRKPCLVYGVGYGSMFDPANAANSGQPHALTFLQTVQFYGNTAADTNGANFPDWQRIYGDNATRQTRLQAAFTRIMQSGVQVSLIE